MDDGQSARLRNRIASLSKARLQAVLDNAEINEAQEEGDSHWPKESWAFTRHLPTLKEMLSSGSSEIDSCLHVLQHSSTFACPDGTCALLEAYGLPSNIFQVCSTVRILLDSPLTNQGLPKGLWTVPPCRDQEFEHKNVKLCKGSAVERDHGEEREAALSAARSNLKCDIQMAWSREAVSRGVEHAKSGNYDAAQECYKQAMELCPQNHDAFVASGAAHANQKQFPEALERFEEALELRPGDGNAVKYRDTVQQRLLELRAAEEDVSRLANHSLRSATELCSDIVEAAPVGQDAVRKLGVDIREGCVGERTGESESSGSEGERRPMGTEEALRIVSGHYGKRKAAVPFLTCAESMMKEAEHATFVAEPKKSILCQHQVPAALGFQRHHSPQEWRRHKNKSKKDKRHKKHKRKKSR